MNKNPPFNFFEDFQLHCEVSSLKDCDCLDFSKSFFFFFFMKLQIEKKKKTFPKHTHNHSVITTSSVHFQTRFKHTFWNWVQIWIVKKNSHSTWWIAFLKQHPLMVIYKMHTIVRRGCNHSNGSLCDTNSLLQFHTVLIPVCLPDIINRTAVGCGLS